MTGKLTIRPQVFEGIFSWGIFLDTEEVLEGLECWQDGEYEGVFVCYAKSIEGAKMAIKLIGPNLNRKEKRQMSNTEKNLRTIINVLVGLLIIVVMAKGQTFELQRAKIEDGKVRIISTKQYNLADAYKERLKLAKDLKPGELLLGPDVLEKVEVAVKEVGESLTVSTTGFTSPEIAAIQRALAGWNVGAERFIWSDNGQIRIRRQRIRDAALSVMNIEGEKVVSGEILVGLSITNLDALQSALGHELGHFLGRADCYKCDSIMTGKTKGRNRTDGHIIATALDLAAIR